MAAAEQSDHEHAPQDRRGFHRRSLAARPAADLIGVNGAPSRPHTLNTSPPAQETLVYKNILVATDGSKLSAKAVRTAIDMARDLGAKITGCYVMPEFPSQVFTEGASLSNYVTPKQYLDGEKARASEILQAVEREAGKAGVECTTTAAQDAHPFEAIIAAAHKRKCDLIVMASHGRRGLQALLLGSETQKVLTHSKVPVLVVR
ncbi:MAG: universal stress protein [Burkholderiales bacterium]